MVHTGCASKVCLHALVDGSPLAHLFHSSLSAASGSNSPRCRFLSSSPRSFRRPPAHDESGGGAHAALASTVTPRGEQECLACLRPLPCLSCGACSLALDPRCQLAVYRRSCCICVPSLICCPFASLLAERLPLDCDAVTCAGALSPFLRLRASSPPRLWLICLRSHMAVASSSLGRSQLIATDLLCLSPRLAGPRAKQARCQCRCFVNLLTRRARGQCGQ
jgi:hypothetical protein